MKLLGINLGVEFNLKLLVKNYDENINMMYSINYQAPIGCL